MNESQGSGPKSMIQRNADQQHADHFFHKLTDTLDKSVEEIDSATLARIRAARREALLVGQSNNSGSGHSQQRQPAWWAPAGNLAALATIAVMAISLWMLPPENLLDSQLPSPDDIALLSDAEALEFYEDLDFYLWLDDEQKSG